MAISDWMITCLKDAAEDMATITEDLNSNKRPCCEEKARFELWDDEDEARLYRRVTAAVKRIGEIIIDFDRVSGKRRGVDK